MENAVILLSGGLDSATAAAIARSEEYQLYGLTLDYGQTHHYELKAAQNIAKVLHFQEHRVLKVPIGQWGGSALIRKGFGNTGTSLAIPKGRSGEEMAEGIPVTYVPARNTVFLSLALAWAEVLRAKAIFLGVNAVDYSGYPDCRPEYVEAFEKLASLATKAAVEEGFFPQIRAPLLHWHKAQIIKKGLELGLDYSLTHSCYDPDRDGLACGACDSCQIRRRGFEEAGLTDPIAYPKRV